MKKILLLSSVSMLLAWGASAQTYVPPVFAPGKLVVLRGGNGLLPLAAGNKQNQVTICEFDPVTNLQAAPLVAVTLPTNTASGLWINASAGSEGQGISRSADRRYIVVTGYTGPQNQAYGTPSSAFLPGTDYPAFSRGFGTIDAFTNFNMVYSDTYNWFGLAPGVTQNNPRGIASLDGTNFWGAGTVAGTATGGYLESGNLFFNPTDNSQLGSPAAATPFQSILSSTYFMRIINGVLYATSQTGSGGALNNGIYTFSTAIGHTPDPLPWLPGVSPSVIDTTNLFCNFGTNGNILTFDMNSSNTVIYAADTKSGIVKFTGNGAGTFVQQYVFYPTNLGTIWTAGSKGAFGLAVDFSQSTTNYNVLYATTLEEGDGSTISSNRLIRIVDNGPPGLTNIAQTLAVCGTNEDFRGLDFSPDLRPLITMQPVGFSTVTNVPVVLSVAANSAYPLTYQWQDNGTNLSDGSMLTGSATSSLNIPLTVVTNSGNYTVIITNIYGAVTSSVAPLLVSLVPVLPGNITSGVIYQTNHIGDTVTFTVNPQSGTQPFAFQWNFATTNLTDDGVKYYGSATASLSITNVQLSDSGNYRIIVTNSAGAVTNLVVVEAVQYASPYIVGHPASSVVLLQGQSIPLTIASGGTAPLAYQWYTGTTKPLTALTDGGDLSGSGTSTLNISTAATTDANNYFCVVTNLGGSATSAVVTVTVLVPPAYSYLSYSNQVYTQNFNSLPNPGANVVNTVGGGGLLLIGTNYYNVGNPFDFAFPTYTNVSSGGVGGLGLTNLSGWYGECDGDGAQGQLGASDGSQTTGGIISFGNTDASQTNRALGLIATSTSGGTHFGLKLVNTTANTLNYLNMQFLGELWKQGSKPKTLQFSYYVDSGSSTFSSSEIALATNNVPVSSQSFGYPVGLVGAANGALAINQTNISAVNLPVGPWAPGQALWLVWSVSDPTGSGQGYAIDNLSLSASATPITAPALSTVSFNSIGAGTKGMQFVFTNAAGVSPQFTVWSTTNLTLPFGQWQNLGHPTETSAGTYQVNDLQSTNIPARYYQVTSP